MSDSTSNETKTAPGWLSIILRHFTTFVAIMAFFWVVAKPHAEEFVRDTVNNRISLIEYKLDYVMRQLNNISNKLDRLDSR